MSGHIIRFPGHFSQNVFLGFLVKKHAKTSHMAHPWGFWGPFWDIQSHFPENRAKSLKFGNFAVLAKQWVEWPPKPSKTILVTKKCCQKALELKNWENCHFERFYAKFDHFWSGSNLTGWLPLKWCLRIKIHFIRFESWYKSQKTNTHSLKNPAQIHET